MNFRLLIWLLVVGLNSGCALAQSPPSSTYSALFICDTDISHMASNCTDVSSQHFLQAGQMLLDNNANPECELNPYDPSCETSTAGPYTEARFLVIHARNATAEYWRVIENVAGFSIEALPTSGLVDGIALKFQQLNSTYLQMLDIYTFTQQQDGRFANELGEYMDEVAPLTVSSYSPLTRSKLVSTQDIARGGFCSTALDYQFGGTCEGDLNRWIRGIDMQNNQPLSYWAQVFEGIDVDLGGLTLKLKDLDRAFDMPFRFKDGSVLVLNINPDKDTRGIPAIKINMDKSYTSEGKTFARYLATRTNSRGVPMSGEEVGSYLSNAGCSSEINVIGYEREYLVTTVTQPDGTSTITSVELIGQQAILETQWVCNGITGLP